LAHDTGAFAWEFDCEEGCPLGAALAEAACGSDGLTYASACLAHCQGVGVAHSGPCEHDASMGIAALLDMGGAAGARGDGSGGRALQQAGVVPASTMNRFRGEGYRCVERTPLSPMNVVRIAPVRPSRARASQGCLDLDAQWDPYLPPLRLLGLSAKAR
jgi:hypothetical protein